MSDDSDLLEIGRIHKAHGIRGEVAVSLTSNREERRRRGSVVIVEGKELVISSVKELHERFIFGFDGITDRNQAETLSGKVMFAAPIDDDGELWVHEMIGCTVVDQGGTERGLVEGVLANPASDLLELSTGFLVPLAFVSRVDGDSKRVFVEVPDGLFDV
ncbi:MAG: ribosome maturation factor RimM [Actinomycetota bacterium]|nr:ribosome maturation factor RimM [Actinomycetota bacterium]